MHRLALVAVMAALSAGASAQVTKSGAGYLIRAKYGQGQTLKYTTVTSLGSTANGGQPMKFSSPIVMRVLKVTGGKAEAEVTVGPIKLGDSPMREAEKLRVTLDSRNQTSGQSGMFGPLLPAKPIRVGQSWTSDAPIPDAMGQAQKLTATYTFKGLKKVKGKSVAELAIKLRGGATGTGTMHLLASDGTIFANNLSMKVMGPQGQVDVKLTMQRI